MEITIGEIKRALYKADLALRPKIVFMNPLDAKITKDVFPEVEETVVIQETEAVGSGWMVIMDRETLEERVINNYENVD